MIKVAFSGARGVGKSTLVKSVQKALRDKLNIMNISYRDGVARNFFELCNCADINPIFPDTKEICIAGQLITDYLEDICDKEDGIVLCSRSLFDLYAYWAEDEIISDVIYDIYGKHPLDLLVVVMVNVNKSSKTLKQIAEERGSNLLDFANKVRYEQDKIIEKVFYHTARHTYFKKLLILENDYTKKTLDSNVGLLTDTIANLFYNERI